MSSELGDSVIFSLQRCCFSARSFARPGPLERVPRRRRYYDALRPLDARRARFPSPRRSCLTGRRDTIPGSWTTLAYVPCSPIPVGAMHRAAALGLAGRALCTAVAFDIRNSLGSHENRLSGLNITAHTLAVYAS